ncbi:XdhC family protein [Methyloferula stellata]|uniref:XdhC family protein n=1 Tax=Methyloferula stellata TaxID=876270 RepID=UPI000368F833|nr:XdhC family protein [Methyloferula stellata]
MRLDLLAALNAERAARRACVLVTDLAAGTQRLVRANEIAADPLAGALQDQVGLGKSGLVHHDGRDWFLSVQIPPSRLIAIGAVHISQALAPIAKLIDLDIVIVDPRTAFASLERFPDVPLIAEWPEVALPPLGLDRFTAVVALCHDPRIDDPALAAALKSECFYIGALGSRKTHAKRLERLRGLGFGEAELGKIHAPIGLDIGAISPAEIAVSIIGELVSARRQKPLRAAAEVAA